MSTRIALLAVVIALVASASVAGPALAGKASNAGQHGGKPGPTATLAVSPNPVIVGSAYTVSGSGFRPSQWVYMSTTCAGSFNVWPDSAGNVTFTEPACGWPGTCKYDAYQYSGRKLVLMATVTFDVVSP